MPARSLVGVLGAGLVLLVPSRSWAQCSKDTECKGDRICEAGQCVAPSASAPVAPKAPPPVAVAPAPPAAAAPARPPAPLLAPRMQRHSEGMMIGGIVLVSMAPLGLFVATLSTLRKSTCLDFPNAQDCDRYDTVTDVAVVGGFLCALAGVPLIAIGGKKEPVHTGPTATISPWATRQAAGLGLRIEM